MLRYRYEEGFFLDMHLLPFCCVLYFSFSNLFHFSMANNG